MNEEQIHIGYMYNPDQVYYHEMDDLLVRMLEENGARVTRLRLEDINFAIDSGKIEMFSKMEKISIDGLLNYGHMSKFHYEAFTYIINTLDMMGIPCLHAPKIEKILNNKYLQALCFGKKRVPIPRTNIGFSVDAFKSMASTHFPNASIFKKLDEYGGDGVTFHSNKDNLINCAAKLFWKNEYGIFQEFIKDSLGKSIRVLCINGKGVACAEYVDKTNNFKSNNSYGFDFFSLDSLMRSPKLNEYYKLAEKAVNAIGNLTIGGVDILESEEKGMVVLEVNGWPDIYDIAHATEIDIFKLFSASFCEKVRATNQRCLEDNL